jgi:aminopeptidase YwaD
MPRLRRCLVRLAVAIVALVLASLVYDWTQSVTARPPVRDRVATVDVERLRAHVAELTAFGPRHEGNAEATAAVQRWLQDELQALGYTVEREPFDALTTIYEPTQDGGFVVRAAQGRKHHNLLATKRGSDGDGAPLEVCAHYDSVAFGPGADDNGSGVAALLEVARLLAAAPTRRTVRLCFFAMEEDGLVGSAAHVKAMQQRGETIAGAIVLDMIGFATGRDNTQATPARVPLVFDPPTRGDFLVVCGNFASGWLGNLYEACATAYVPEARWYSINRIAAWFGDAMRSDHASYWAAGMHAILLSDTAEMRNRNYHKATDTADTLDYPFLLANTRALAATVLHWAGVD